MTDLSLKLTNVVRLIRRRLPILEGHWTLVYNRGNDEYFLYQQYNTSVTRLGPYHNGQLIPLLRGMAMLKEPWASAHTFIETRENKEMGSLYIPESEIPETHKFLALSKDLANKYGTDRLYTKSINDICASNWHRERKGGYFEPPDL